MFGLLSRPDSTLRRQNSEAGDGQTGRLAVCWEQRGGRPMDTKKTGAYLAALRKARGMTQQEAADQLGVSNKTVSKWENGLSYT